MSASPNTIVVSLQGTSMVFNQGGENELIALSDIDLDISSGQFVSLIGPSGCGKSTLLRLVGDLLTPSQGNVQVNGKTANQARMDRDYGMVFQEATLLEWRTVFRNIELPLEVTGHPTADRESVIADLLSLVQLDEFRDHYPWQLSGGMQQRVAIARALAFDPSILLMDEPFGALDEMTRERMQMELMGIWQQTGKSVLFVTHSIPEAVFLSSRVVVMSPRPGRIIEVIDIDLPVPRVLETREQPAFFNKLTEVREALRSQGDTA